MAAATSSNPLPGIQGDQPLCLTSATIQGYYGTFCLELGTFRSGSQQYITAQVAEFCTTGTQNKPCSNAVVTATIANGAGYSLPTQLKCGHTNGACEASENWFYPFGELPISPGVCDNNVWAVIFGANADTYITLPVSGKNVDLGGFNPEDGHFTKVCEAADGSFFVQK